MMSSVAQLQLPLFWLNYHVVLYIADNWRAACRQLPACLTGRPGPAACIATAIALCAVCRETLSQVRICATTSGMHVLYTCMHVATILALIAKLQLTLLMRGM